MKDSVNTSLSASCFYNCLNKLPSPIFFLPLLPQLLKIDCHRVRLLMVQSIYLVVVVLI